MLFDPQASQRELIWVIRLSIVVAGATATALGLLITSVYDLFVFCSDFVYVVLFPQFFCVVYFSKCNTYGSLSGYLVSLVLRFGGGDSLLGIPPLIKYPFYDETEGQLFPFKTLAMACGFLTILLVSYPLDYLFKSGKLAKKYDFFKCVVNVPPTKDDDSIQMVEEENCMKEMELEMKDQ